MTEKAEPLFTQILEEQGDIVLREASASGLGRTSVDQERYNEAEDLFTRGIEIGQRERLGENNPHTLKYMNALAVLCTKQKRYTEAEKSFKKASEARKDKLGDDHPDTLESKHDLGVLYKELEWYDDAEPLLLEAVEGRILKLGERHPHTQESLNNLIELYEAWATRRRPSSRLRVWLRSRLRLDLSNTRHRT